MNKMQNFTRFGFRRNTHDKDGRFKRESANIWQAHVWNRSIAGFVGKEISSRTAQPFDEVVKVCQERWTGDDELDEEDIALALIHLVECGLAVVEQAADYNTDLYDDGVKFWKR
jgi:hypothetical protein